MKMPASDGARRRNFLAQELKRLWHVVLAFGDDAEPTPT